MPRFRCAACLVAVDGRRLWLPRSPHDSADSAREPCCVACNTARREALREGRALAVSTSRVVLDANGHHAGRGLFALVPIAANRTITRFGGVEYYDEPRAGAYVVRVYKRLWVDTLPHSRSRVDPGALGTYANCVPDDERGNAAISVSGGYAKWRCTLRSTRAIAAGEEILVTGYGNAYGPMPASRLARPEDPPVARKRKPKRRASTRTPLRRSVRPRHTNATIDEPRRTARVRTPSTRTQD